MKLYYVEFDTKDSITRDNPSIAHYLEISSLGIIIEHRVPINDESDFESVLIENTYYSWKDYFNSYKGGKKEFEKYGHMVRVL